MKEYQKKINKIAILTRERLGIICCSPEEKKKMNAEKGEKKRRSCWGRVRSACCWFIHLFIYLFAWLWVRRRSFCRSFCRLSGTNGLLEAEERLQTDSCSAPPLGALGALGRLGRLETWAQICRCQSGGGRDKTPKEDIWQLLFTRS